MKQIQCRVWWPEHLTSCKPIKDIALFGWCISLASDSVDFVVATGASEGLLRQLDVTDFLDHVNKRMLQSLNSRSTFCLLGSYESPKLCDKISNVLSFERLHSGPGHVDNNSQNLEIEASPCMISRCEDKSSQEKKSLSSCDRNLKCYDALNDLSEMYCVSSSRIKDWVQLDNACYTTFKSKWIPEFRYFRSRGQLLPVNNAHIIVYQLPSFCKHHFSMSNWTSFNRVAVPSKKPQWVNELQKGQSSFDLDLVVTAINCANAAEKHLEKCLGLNSSLQKPSVTSRLIIVVWHTLAALLASLSAILYMALSFGHSFIAHSLIYSFSMTLVNFFAQTSKNIQIRGSQLLYWPFLLQGYSSRSQPNVEYAHRAAMKRHALWSTIAVDLLLGNILGLLLLTHSQGICFWAFRISSFVTDDILRSGCVWLMGVPAGFKLNTELAEILGLVSLNAIQIWSTLWFYVGSLLLYYVNALALSGMFLGATIPAALCIDLLKLATFHVTALHTLIALLYSRQIWALTSLWRLFRGQKWNPLRQRLDSFDYTVDQHVVGSLLFTPNLLLLPTTSVFYIFFTIISSCISIVCIALEVCIAVLHATPYAEVFLWAFARSRFPSGLWLELRNPCRQKVGISAKKPVLFLRSNNATLDPWTLLCEHLQGGFFIWLLYPWSSQGPKNTINVRSEPSNGHAMEES
ncbi:N-acetylglucosaminyl transferase component family protein / Gpi1 family protein isoform X2 [Wolffia australiana]